MLVEMGYVDNLSLHFLVDAQAVGISPHKYTYNSSSVPVHP